MTWLLPAFIAASLFAAVTSFAAAACVANEDPIGVPVGLSGAVGYGLLAALASQASIREAGLGVVIAATAFLASRYVRRGLTCPICPFLWGLNVVLVVLGVALAVGR